MENIKNLRVLLYKALFLTGTLLFLAQCHSQKKVEYELPDAMLAHVKPFYAAQCEKGKILYDLNCAGCHTTKVKSKEIIPDFSPSQLTGYTLRVQNAQHEKNMPDSMVTE
ncbi:MAG: c-type cytochrome, partial [Bacteroidia bacterium]